MKYQPLEIVKCPQCGDEFMPRNTSQVYCGSTCRARAARAKERQLDPKRRTVSGEQQMVPGQQFYLVPDGNLLQVQVYLNLAGKGLETRSALLGAKVEGLEDLVEGKALVVPHGAGQWVLEYFGSVTPPADLPKALTQEEINRRILGGGK